MNLIYDLDKHLKWKHLDWTVVNSKQVFLIFSYFLKQNQTSCKTNWKYTSEFKVRAYVCIPSTTTIKFWFLVTDENRQSNNWMLEVQKKSEKMSSLSGWFGFVFSLNLFKFGFLPSNHAHVSILIPINQHLVGNHGLVPQTKTHVVWYSCSEETLAFWNTIFHTLSFCFLFENINALFKPLQHKFNCDCRNLPKCLECCLTI